MIIAVEKVRITTNGLSSFQMFTHHPQISNTVGAIPHFVVDIINNHSAMELLSSSVS